MPELKIREIKAVFIDVDGVLTDGRITIDAEGKETKCFDVKDGLGLKMLLSSGIEVVLISGRKSEALEKRAKALGIEEIYQGVRDKRTVCRSVLDKLGLEMNQALAIGDDLPDIPMFMECGVGVAVGDAAVEVRESADFITKKRGGCGAVREVCEWILKAQSKWDSTVDMVSGKTYPRTRRIGDI